MKISRRTFLNVSGVGIATFILNKWAVAQNLEVDNVPLPNKTTFESGDLIWPKKPGAYVPYRYGQRDYSLEEEEKLWLQERDEFLKSAKNNPQNFSPTQLNDLKNLSYREFYEQYAGDKKPDVPRTYSSGRSVYVGHVGILELDETGTPWVIEALWGNGVVRHKYDDWIKDRPGEIVWHGRLSKINKNQQEKVVTESKKYIGRPYDFWNFDLNDESGFYCSKLVWLSFYRALNLAVDENYNAKRTFWLSPKKLLYAETILRLHNPGSYTNL